MAIVADRSSVAINPPEDLELAALWDLAVEVVEARLKAPPATRADWNAVVAEYHAQLAKAPALTRDVIRAVAAEPPRMLLPACCEDIVIPLRETLTPFARQLAAALEPTPTNARGIRVRIVDAAEAAKALPRVCDRQGLTGKPFTYLRQADGRLTSSWADSPTIWVNKWAGRETAIVLKEDAQGPLELRFLTRLATDTVQDVMRVGNAEQASRELLRAYWDAGIREIRAEVRAELGDVVMTDARRERLSAIPEFVMTRRDRGDGWLEQTSRITARP